MTRKEITDEIFFILEKGLMRRGMAKSEITMMKNRLNELINMLEPGEYKDKILEKIRNKQRFVYIINDTGLLDFTGYGIGFW